METKLSEEKLLKLITKVNTALNSMGQKLAGKINEIMKDISDVKEELDNETTRNINGMENIEERLAEMAKQISSKDRQTEDLDIEIKNLKESYKINEMKIVELEVQILSLSKACTELTVDKALNEGYINSEENEAYDPESNVEITNNMFNCNKFGEEPLHSNKIDIRSKERVFKCNVCGEKVQNRYTLESHMITMHDHDKSYTCNYCDMKFVSKWRMNKHMNMHEDKTKRKCHYFNNDKECPFVKNGCKFLHEESSECKFGKSCDRTMCQYRH